MGQASDGTQAEAPEPRAREGFGNAYELFILVLTVLSLIIMVVLLIPGLDPATEKLLGFYDNAICVVFLLDFGLRMHRARPRRRYFVGERGWLDLLGSMPSVGIFRASALLRLARLSRLARIARLLRGQNKREILRDVLENRGEYAVFITVISAMVVLILASVFVLQFESGSPDANITNGGNALWWAIVTITTVGYGDRYPVTPGGRITGVFVMVAGVGIIASLASILASVLIPPPKTPAEPAPQATVEDVAALRREVAEMHGELTALRDDLTRDRD